MENGWRLPLDKKRKPFGKAWEIKAGAEANLQPL